MEARASGRRIQSVDDLSDAIKLAITSSPAMRGIAVRGELQNFKRHTSGHVYFTLMGERSRISCVMFRSNASSVVSWPRDGDEVVVTGNVDTYPKGGSYQLYANRLMPLGAGALARAREEVRRRLEQEGAFDPRFKRPIPRSPAKVAVVTSPTGAALQDILKVSGRRAPFIDIVVIPALVQGVEAPDSIVSALRSVARAQGVECAILARGGGSQDDLAVFDDERVVRALRACPVPVVTGVGHEIDTTLVDHAADLRAPTPSAAAELVFPDVLELRAAIDWSLKRMSRCAQMLITSSRDAADRALQSMSGAVLGLISDDEATIDRSLYVLSRGVENVLDRAQDRLASCAARLDALSPLSAFARGYVCASREDGSAVSSVGDVEVGDAVLLTLKDGKIKAEVLERTSAQTAIQS